MAQDFVAAPYGSDEPMNAQISCSPDFVFVSYTRNVGEKPEVQEFRDHDGVVLAQVCRAKIPEGIKPGSKYWSPVLRLYFDTNDRGNLLEIRIERNADKHERVIEYGGRCNPEGEWMNNAPMVQKIDDAETIKQKMEQALLEPGLFVQNGNTHTTSPYIVNAETFGL